MMDSFLSILPKGLFGLHTNELSSDPSSMMLVDDGGRKRGRKDEAGSRTPTLLMPRATTTAEDENRPVKRFRGEWRVIPVSHEPRKVEERPKSPVSKLPEDVVAHCLSFLCSVEDRVSLQCTSKQFHRISNSDAMLSKIQVGGDRKTGAHGIIREQDTPEIASRKLESYATADNLEAIYMLGIIKSYCHQDVEGGIQQLKYAASKGYVRASYALGLALRDSQPSEAADYMKDAADQGYIPALQELLPARKMKAKYGEPKAEELRLHLDPLCLNRLLSRYYVESADLRELNTSHCWNPLCGRWAFKATVNHNTNERTIHRPLGFHFRQDSTHASDSEASVANEKLDLRVSRMKMCSRCCRAKYCSKLCQVYDWRSGRHKMECQFL